MSASSLEGSCHCGAARLQIDSPLEEVTDCNCSICRRYGTLWAYFQRSQVRVIGATQVYLWGRKSIEFHRCAQCGCVTHWQAVDKTFARMGVNARIMQPETLALARKTQFNGAER